MLAKERSCQTGCNASSGWRSECFELDEDSGGPENDVTPRNTTFMTWNLTHPARLLKDNGGVPAHGTQRPEWETGCRFDRQTSNTGEEANSELPRAC